MIETFWAMETITFATFMAAAMILYCTPGVDMMFTLASGISGGPKAGMAAAAGISTGVLVHVVMAAVGIAALLAAHPAAYDAIRYCGAAYLAWLAVQSWYATPDARMHQGSVDIWRAFRRGFLTNILNPKVALFVVAFLPQFANADVGPIWHQIIILGLCLTVGGLITDGIFGLMAGAMADRLRRSSNVMNKIAAIVFGGLAVRLAAN